MLDPKLLHKFSIVAARAAYSSSLLKGKNDKIAADQAAVDSMRNYLNKIEMNGKIVIGEGEMDEAPMLYIGEKLGTGDGEPLDIAVDPLDGTTLTAKNLPNAISVIAVSEKGNLLQAPDTYMEKIAIGPGFPENIVDLDNTVEKNLKNIAEFKSVKISDLTVCLLERDRHIKIINSLNKLSVNIKFISDGDVLGAIYTCINNFKVDMYVGTGGAPEGVLAAAAIKGFGGQFQGRLVISNNDEKLRATKLGISDMQKKYYLNDLVKGDVIFCAAGVTDGEILKGIRVEDSNFLSDLLVLHSDQKIIKIYTETFEI
ncbi:MAG: class II fructose-bisphosphatase [Proteobacteria bacterium]|nr:class II fructose-bisphosphatase [Pseudomonadota bacterium]MDA0971187.1 class II fructose-bisphosphatase [Pseudomonadota bacterium]